MQHCFLANGTYPCLLFTGNSDSANKVAEKLEELSVKDKASVEKKEEEKKETEKKEVKDEKNWEPRTCFCWSSIYRFFLFFYNRL